MPNRAVVLSRQAGNRFLGSLKDLQIRACPHGRRNYTCVLLPLYYIFSLTSLPPSQTKCTVYTD
ncbi:MAG: hypothetical protein ACK56F_14730, partial [bacterium]